MILANEPQNFWLGGQFSLTKGAQTFAENIKYEQFYYGLRQLFFFDYFSPAIHDWIVDQWDYITLTSLNYYQKVFRATKPSNNTQACYGMIDPRMCEVLYYEALHARQNISAFFVADLSNDGISVLFVELLRWFLSGVSKIILQ